MTIRSRKIIALPVGGRLLRPDPPAFTPEDIASVESGATAEWWISTNSTAVLNPSGSAVSKGEEADQLIGQNGVASTDYTTGDGDAGDGSGTLYPILWQDNNLNRTGGSAGWWSAPLATDPANEGIGAFCSFSFTGSPSINSIDLFWLQQNNTGPWFGGHAQPAIMFDQTADGIRFELTDASGDNHIISRALNDGEIHTAGWTYSTSDGQFRIYVDGALETTFTPSGTVVTGNRVQASCGDRSGINHDSWKAVVVKGFVTEAEAASVDEWLRRDAKLNSKFVEASAVAASGDEDTSITGTLDASSIQGNTLSYSVTSGPSNGSVSLSGADFTYTPDPDYFGSDSFDYEASDSAGSDTATVSLTINSVPDIIVEDTFTEASSVALTAHTPDTDTTGLGWFVSANATATVDGEAHITSTLDRAVGYIKPGDSSLCIRGEYAGTTLLLAARFIDEDNYLLAQWFGTTLRLLEWVAGSATVLDSTSVASIGAGSTMWVSDDGSEVRLGVNGNAPSLTIATTRHNSSNFVGIAGSSASTFDVDNFVCINNTDYRDLP